MSQKTATTGRLLWTRLEEDYSPERKAGFQVAYANGLSKNDISMIERMVTPWDYKTPLKSVALPGERIAVARFTALKQSFTGALGDLYHRMMDKSYRGGIYIADVRVYDAPRWRCVDSLEAMQEAMAIYD